jgi:hypothetical protein
MSACEPASVSTLRKRALGHPVAFPAIGAVTVVLLLQSGWCWLATTRHVLPGKTPFVVRHEVRRLVSDASTHPPTSVSPYIAGGNVRWCGWLAPTSVLPAPPEDCDWDIVLGSVEPEHVRSRIVCEASESPATVDVSRAPVVTASAPDSATVGSSIRRQAGKPLTFTAACDDVYHLPGTNGDLTRLEAWVRIAGRPWLCGQWVRVVLDKQVPLAEIDPRLGRAIVDELERRVVVAAQDTWGPSVPWQSGTPLTVLITPWVARASQAPVDHSGALAAGSGNGTASGLFRPDDLRGDVPEAMSCGRPVIYLHSGLRPGAHLNAVLAHEFTHYFVCATRLQATGHVRQQDWLNEGLAHLGETQLGAGVSNLEHRLAAFRTTSANSPLVVANAATSGRWRDPGCRGAAYLFTLWCAEQYGDRFVPDLAAEPESGAAGVSRVLGRPFEQLFLEWGAHLAEREELAPMSPSRPFELSGTAVARVRLTGEKTRNWRITAENDGSGRVFVLARAIKREDDRVSSVRWTSSQTR